MSGIEQKIVPDPRSSLIARHLPSTSQVQQLLRREGRAYVCNDLETLGQVIRAIIESGEQTGIDHQEDDYERYGLYFPEAIDYIIRVDGIKTPLY